MSLADVILNCNPDLKPVIPHIHSHPEKIIFSLEGFDDLKVSFCVAAISSNDPNQKRSLEDNPGDLLSKNILPRSFLLIASRPGALDILKTLLEDPCYVEILGCSQEGVEEYVQNFFDND